jgi:predicted kinase
MLINIGKKDERIMPKIYATIGLCGSGKSTYAEQQCADGSGMRANRDDIRYLLYGVYYGDPIDEQAVSRYQDELVAEILGGGYDAWIDDTNLSGRARKHVRELAETHGVEVVWVDFTHVPLDTCIERDSMRERQVGAEVIVSMWDRYLNPKQF